MPRKEKYLLSAGLIFTGLFAACTPEVPPEVVNPALAGTPRGQSSGDTTPVPYALTPQPAETGPRRRHPYTGLWYQQAAAPRGYESWQCFRVPPGGTVFGSILVGGTSTSTRYDTPEGAAFVNGTDLPPVTFDTRPSPDDWPDSVQSVPSGTVGCSR